MTMNRRFWNWWWVRNWMIIAGIIASVDRAEAKDFFSAPQEKDLLTCGNGTVLRGIFYETRKKINTLVVNDKNDYMLCVDENGIYRICDKRTFKIMSELKSNPMVTRNGYFLTKQAKASFYNFNNEKLWTANGPYVYSSDTLGITVFMKSEGVRYVDKGLLEGVDINTGNILWKSTVPYKYHYPWTEIFTVKEHPNYRYLIADSLYLLDTKTGRLTSHAFCPSVKESGKSIFSIAKSTPLPSNEWRIEAAMSYDHIGRMTGTHSRWVQSGDSLFIADAENLYCFNLSLEEIWRTPIPDAMGSKSCLQVRGDKLYLLNFGIGFQKGFVGRAGRVFYATYDKSTGRQLQLVVPDTNKKLYGGLYVPRKIYLQDNSDLYYIDEGGKEVHTLKWTPETNIPAEYNIPERVIYDTIYVKKDGKLEPITTNDRQLVVELNDYDVNVVNISNGKVTKYPGSEVFFHDYRNVYSTNSRKTHRYAIVNDKTMKIRYDFSHAGYCLVTDNGDIWLVNDYGIGVILQAKILH